MLIDREAARILGLTTYQGRPCPTCRSCERGVSNGACAPCNRRNAALYRQVNRDRDRAAKMERKRLWCQANPDKVAQQRRRHLARHGDTMRAQRVLVRSIATNARLAAKARHAADAATLRLIERAFRSADADDRRRAYDREKQRRRRAVMRGARGQAGAKVHRVLLELQGGACAYCGETDDLHLDHRHPIALGGQHTWDNLQWLCAPHNIRKKAQPDRAFRIEHGIPDLTPWDVAFGLLLIAAEP